MTKILDLKGQIFGDLTVLSDAILKPRKDGRNNSWFLCECSCGNQFEVVGHALKSGNTKSCGKCSHGHSTGNNGKPTPTYYSWISAKNRTKIKPGHKDYEIYKDVSMCDRWFNSFEAFLKDMGERPPGTTLDRYPDKTGNYEPDNCRWATYKEQTENRDKPKTLNKNNTSGITGVGFDKSRSKWYARIKVNYKEIYLGRFDTKEEAINARKNAEAKYYKPLLKKVAFLPEELLVA